jgi:hypothetical protein
VKPSPVPAPSPAPAPASKPKPKPKLVTVEGEKYYKVPSGSIAWKQGIFWKYIPPPWNQEKPITLDYPPIGAKNIGETTPAKTIQMIGKARAKVPKSASVDLGVVDVFIDDYGQKIAFTGKGEQTAVGERVSGTTQGMSIPGISPARIRGASLNYKKMAFGTSLSSLVMETYREDIPKKFAEKALSHKLSKMAPKDIAKEIRGVSEKRKDEIFKMLPDRVRKQVELWESMLPEYAPTRGWPKAPYLPGKLRRKKKKNAKVLKEAELVASAAAIRG